MKIPHLDWPLMRNNIIRDDLDQVVSFLAQDDPILTQSTNVREFENEWSDWLDVRHSVFVNSGSSANLLTMSALKHLYGDGEIVVPTLTWVSDVASVIQCGFTPVFTDIDPHTLGMDFDQVCAKISSKTRAIFLTHVLGFNALSQRLLDLLLEKKIPLIEDVCESHGATFAGKKLGSYGLMSNFSFYYAHHMSTIEGGMISTDNADLYEVVRMLRSHGMAREVHSAELRQQIQDDNPDLNPDFIFRYPGYNVRSSEINALIGRNQLKRLDANNEIRQSNFQLFLDNLDRDRYFIEFDTEGSCNYAFTLVLRYADDALRDGVMSALRSHGVEFRRGASGGGNQLRQPYLRDRINAGEWSQYPRVEHIHFYGFYIGNYPGLEEENILHLCALLNGVQGEKV